MSNRTCGDCRFFESTDFFCCHWGTEVESDVLACSKFKPIPRPTNGDVIRQGGDRELAEISVYEATMPEGEIIYRSTLIVDKFFLTKNCAVAVVEAWLNAPAEAESEVTDETN